MSKANDYSVFVSHSSEDKIPYVDDLVYEMKKIGLNVFYDTDVISWGDDLKEKIDYGLKTCQLAVIVISKSYFGREWTEYEIQSLLIRQNNEGCKIILPILYNVSKEDFQKHYPLLKNIVFKHAKSQKKAELAKEIKRELEKKQRRGTDE